MKLANRDILFVFSNFLLSALLVFVVPLIWEMTPCERHMVTFSNPNDGFGGTPVGVMICKETVALDILAYLIAPGMAVAISYLLCKIWRYENSSPIAKVSQLIPLFVSPLFPLFLYRSTNQLSFTGALIPPALRPMITVVLVFIVLRALTKG